MRKLLKASIFIAFAVPAHAQQAPTATVSTPAIEEIVVKGKVPDGQKRVCKNSVATGSILTKKVCRSKDEWAEIRERSITAMERSKAEARARDHARATIENGGS